MTRWRTYFIAFLLISPILVFVGVGGWALWQSGHLLWLWLTLPAAWGVALLLARLWGKQLVPLDKPKTEQPLYWTPRDQEAWKFVEAKVATADDVEAENFTTLQFYVDTSRDLADEIAHFYHPDANDPISELTIPEIMAAAQLALEDLTDLYGRYVPGGHMLTVSNWKSLAKLPKKYKLISNLATAAAALFNPLVAAGRLVASKTVTAPVTRAIRANLLGWFYTAFLQRTGFYLIEMNSGRLSGGKEKFREAFDRLSKSQERPWEDRHGEDDRAKPPSAARGLADTETEDELNSSILESTAGGPEGESITVCVVGQSGSGRSSIVKSLLNDADERTERLKKAETVTVHRVNLRDGDDELRVLETIGYSNYEESKSIRKDRWRAIAQSDLLLLAMNATSSARDADVQFLNDMTDWFATQPQLKPPPVIVALSHIDLLKPPMIWAPPYNWREPTEMKEESIRDAVEHVRGELGGRIVNVVPVCSDVTNGRAFGITEWLEPALVAALDEARAVGSVRQLHEDLDTGKVSRVLNQVWNIGKALRGR